MRKLLFIFLASVLALGYFSVVLLSAQLTRAQLADSAWPMFCHDAQHTGRSPYSGPEMPELKWRYATGGPIFLCRIK